MADDKTNIGSPDRDRISLGEDYEIRNWTRSLGVSEAELREAVDAVGNSVDAVRAYLKNAFIAEIAWRASRRSAVAPIGGSAGVTGAPG